MCSSFQLPATAGELVLGQVVPARGHKDIRTSSGWSLLCARSCENGKTIEKDWTYKNGNGGRVGRGLPLDGNALYMWAKRNDTIEKEGILQHPHVLAP